MVTISAFGDSLTECIAIKDNPLLKNWTDIIEEKLGVRVHNFGVGGNNTRQALDRIDDVLKIKSDYTLVEFGMNDQIIMDDNGDVQVGIDEFSLNIKKICDLCIENGSEPILITPNYVIEDYYYTRHKKSRYDYVFGANNHILLYRNALLSIAEENHYYYVDMYSEFYKEKDNLHNLLRSETNGNFTDGVHLYGDGLEFYATKVIDVLTEILKNNL